MSFRPTWHKASLSSTKLRFPPHRLQGRRRLRERRPLLRLPRPASRHQRTQFLRHIRCVILGVEAVGAVHVGEVLLHLAVGEAVEGAVGAQAPHLPQGHAEGVGVAAVGPVALKKGNS